MMIHRPNKRIEARNNSSNSMKKLTFITITLLSTLPQVALAQQAHEAPPSARATLGATGALMGGDVFWLADGPNFNIHLYGGALTYQWRNGLTVEGGMVAMTALEGPHPRSLHLRAGYTWQLHGPRGPGKGWREFINPFIGYRRAVWQEAWRDAYAFSHRGDAVQLGASYDIQWGGRTSVFLRLTAAAGYALTSRRVDAIGTTDDNGPVTAHVTVQTAIGVAFRDPFVRQ